jgi:hypothetical protein
MVRSSLVATSIAALTCSMFTTASLAAGSLSKTLTGRHIINRSVICGDNGSSTSGGVGQTTSMVGEALFTPEPTMAFNAWLAALPNAPFNVTTQPPPAVSNSTIGGFSYSGSETPFEWGRLDRVFYQGGATGWGTSSYTPQANFGTVPFFITSVTLSPAAGIYTTGYFIYLWELGQGSFQSTWRRSQVVLKNPNGTSTEASYQDVVPAGGACVNKTDFHG